MEPATLMYFQKGVWGEIKRMVADDDYLNNHIGFKDQKRNRELAQQGSLDRSYATLDLSSASDLVGYDLVKQLFKGTKLLRYLICTRSQKTQFPDGTQKRLRKFAPMGSALCFPVETLVFAAICELVTRELRVAGDYSVYGDDIIVPTRCAERVMDVLGRLNFRVNREKSFYDAACWFRESCGGEFCDGFDVTPLRVTRKYAHAEQDVRLNALIDTANSAYDHGFRNLRQFYLRMIRDLGFIPLFSPDALKGDNYTNYHTRSRWMKDWQSIYVLVTDQNDRYKRDDLRHQDESIRYRHWHESAAIRKHVDSLRKAKREFLSDRVRSWIRPNEFVSDPIESIICKSTKSTKGTWRMKPYELSDQEFIDSNTGRGNLSVPDKAQPMEG